MSAPHPNLAAIAPASYLLDAATRLHRATVQIGNLRLRPWNITLPSYVALRVIAEQPKLTLTQLSRRCFVRPQTMTRMVNQLEKRGFIARRPQPRDDRAMSLELTPAGRKALAQMEAAVNEINDTIDDVLSAEQVLMVDRLLRHCASAVENGINHADDH